MEVKKPQNHQIQLAIHASLASPQSNPPLLARFNAGYFHISLSLCGQALIWKTLSESTEDAHAFRRILRMLSSKAFLLLWCVTLFILLFFSLYFTYCFFHFHMVKKEFLHHVGVNHLLAPWISWLLLLQTSRYINPKTMHHLVLWGLFALPVVALDVKIYGQWSTKGKRFLSIVANPTSQLLSVIGNLVCARTAAEMGWKESAVFMFSLGISHYLVLFVTLYQRLSGSQPLPAMLSPVFFLFIATPSMASLAWDSICGSFNVPSKMLFFLSLFLFASLVVRPVLLKRSMQRFHVTWWAYSFPLKCLGNGLYRVCPGGEGWHGSYTDAIVASPLSYSFSGFGSLHCFQH